MIHHHTFPPSLSLTQWRHRLWVFLDLGEILIYRHAHFAWLLLHAGYLIQQVDLRRVLIFPWTHPLCASHNSLFNLVLVAGYDKDFFQAFVIHLVDTSRPIKLSHFQEYLVSLVGAWKQLSVGRKKTEGRSLSRGVMVSFTWVLGCKGLRIFVEIIEVL